MHLFDYNDLVDKANLTNEDFEGHLETKISLFMAQLWGLRITIHEVAFDTKDGPIIADVQVFPVVTPSSDWLNINIACDVRGNRNRYYALIPTKQDFRRSTVQITKEDVEEMDLWLSIEEFIQLWLYRLRVMDVEHFGSLKEVIRRHPHERIDQS